MSEPKSPQAEQKTPPTAAVPTDTPAMVVVEIGGRESGLEPTRYGDWEKNGRCIDF
jgi:hypothetical protein